MDKPGNRKSSYLSSKKTSIGQHPPTLSVRRQSVAPRLQLRGSQRSRLRSINVSAPPKAKVGATAEPQSVLPCKPCELSPENCKEWYDSWMGRPEIQAAIKRAEKKSRNAAACQFIRSLENRQFLLEAYQRGREMLQLVNKADRPAVAKMFGFHDMVLDPSDRQADSKLPEKKADEQQILEDVLEMENERAGCPCCGIFSSSVPKTPREQFAKICDRCEPTEIRLQKRLDVESRDDAESGVEGLRAECVCRKIEAAPTSFGVGGSKTRSSDSNQVSVDKYLSENLEIQIPGKSSTDVSSQSSSFYTSKRADQIVEQKPLAESRWKSCLLPNPCRSKTPQTESRKRRAVASMFEETAHESCPDLQRHLVNRVSSTEDSQSFSAKQTRRRPQSSSSDPTVVGTGISRQLSESDRLDFDSSSSTGIAEDVQSLNLLQSTCSLTKEQTKFTKRFGRKMRDRRFSHAVHPARGTGRRFEESETVSQDRFRRLIKAGSFSFVRPVGVERNYRRQRNLNEGGVRSNDISHVPNRTPNVTNTRAKQPHGGGVPKTITDPATHKSNPRPPSGTNLTSVTSTAASTRSSATKNPKRTAACGTITHIPLCCPGSMLRNPKTPKPCGGQFQGSTRRDPCGCAVYSKKTTADKVQSPVIKKATATSPRSKSKPNGPQSCVAIINQLLRSKGSGQKGGRLTSTSDGSKGRSGQRSNVGTDRGKKDNPLNQTTDASSTISDAGANDDRAVKGARMSAPTSHVPDQAIEKNTDQDPRPSGRRKLPKETFPPSATDTRLQSTADDLSPDENVSGKKSESSPRYILRESPRRKYGPSSAIGIQRQNDNSHMLGRTPRKTPAQLVSEHPPCCGGTQARVTAIAYQVNSFGRNRSRTKPVHGLSESIGMVDQTHARPIHLKETTDGGTACLEQQGTEPSPNRRGFESNRQSRTTINTEIITPRETVTDDQIKRSSTKESNENAAISADEPNVTCKTPTELKNTGVQNRTGCSSPSENKTEGPNKENDNADFTVTSESNNSPSGPPRMLPPEMAALMSGMFPFGMPAFPGGMPVPVSMGTDLFRTFNHENISQNVTQPPVAGPGVSFPVRNFNWSPSVNHVPPGFPLALLIALPNGSFTTVPLAGQNTMAGYFPLEDSRVQQTGTVPPGPRVVTVVPADHGSAGPHATFVNQFAGYHPHQPMVDDPFLGSFLPNPAQASDLFPTTFAGGTLKNDVLTMATDGTACTMFPNVAPIDTGTRPPTTSGGQRLSTPAVTIGLQIYTKNAMEQVTPVKGTGVDGFLDRTVHSVPVPMGLSKLPSATNNTVQSANIQGGSNAMPTMGACDLSAFPPGKIIGKPEQPVFQPTETNAMSTGENTAYTVRNYFSFTSKDVAPSAVGKEQVTTARPLETTSAGLIHAAEHERSHAFDTVQGLGGLSPLKLDLQGTDQNTVGRIPCPKESRDDVPEYSPGFNLTTDWVTEKRVSITAPVEPNDTEIFSITDATGILLTPVPVTVVPCVSSNSIPSAPAKSDTSAAVALESCASTTPDPSVLVTSEPSTAIAPDLPAALRSISLDKEDPIVAISSYPLCSDPAIHQASPARPSDVVSETTSLVPVRPSDVVNETASLVRPSEVVNETIATTKPITAMCAPTLIPGEPVPTTCILSPAVCFPIPVATLSSKANKNEELSPNILTKEISFPIMSAQVQTTTETASGIGYTVDVGIQVKPHVKMHRRSSSTSSTGAKRSGVSKTTLATKHVTATTSKRPSSQHSVSTVITRPTSTGGANFKTGIIDRKHASEPRIATKLSTSAIPHTSRKTKSQTNTTNSMAKNRKPTDSSEHKSQGSSTTIPFTFLEDSGIGVDTAPRRISIDSYGNITTHSPIKVLSMNNTIHNSPQALSPKPWSVHQSQTDVKDFQQQIDTYQPKDTSPTAALEDRITKMASKPNVLEENTPSDAPGNITLAPTQHMSTFSVKAVLDSVDVKTRVFMSTMEMSKESVVAEKREPQDERERTVDQPKRTVSVGAVANGTDMLQNAEDVDVSEHETEDASVSASDNVCSTVTEEEICESKGEEYIDRNEQLDATIQKERFDDPGRRLDPKVGGDERCKPNFSSLIESDTEPNAEQEVTSDSSSVPPLNSLICIPTTKESLSSENSSTTKPTEDGKRASKSKGSCIITNLNINCKTSHVYIDSNPTEVNICGEGPRTFRIDTIFGKSEPVIIDEADEIRHSTVDGESKITETDNGISVHVKDGELHEHSDHTPDESHREARNDLPNMIITQVDSDYTPQSDDNKAFGSALEMSNQEAESNLLKAEGIKSQGSDSSENICLCPETDDSKLAMGRSTDRSHFGPLDNKDSRAKEENYVRDDKSQVKPLLIQEEDHRQSSIQRLEEDSRAHQTTCSPPGSRTSPSSSDHKGFSQFKEEHSKTDEESESGSSRRGHLKKYTVRIGDDVEDHATRSPAEEIPPTAETADNGTTNINVSVEEGESYHPLSFINPRPAISHSETHGLDSSKPSKECVMCLVRGVKKCVSQMHLEKVICDEYLIDEEPARPENADADDVLGVPEPEDGKVSSRERQDCKSEWLEENEDSERKVSLSSTDKEIGASVKEKKDSGQPRPTTDILVNPKSPQIIDYEVPVTPKDLQVHGKLSGPDITKNAESVSLAREKEISPIEIRDPDLFSQISSPGESVGGSLSSLKIPPVTAESSRKQLAKPSQDLLPSVSAGALNETATAVLGSVPLVAKRFSSGEAMTGRGSTFTPSDLSIDGSCGSYPYAGPVHKAAICFTPPANCRKECSLNKDTPNGNEGKTALNDVVPESLRSTNGGRPTFSYQADPRSDLTTTLNKTYVNTHMRSNDKSSKKDDRPTGPNRVLRKELSRKDLADAVKYASNSLCNQETKFSEKKTRFRVPSCGFFSIPLSAEHSEEDSQSSGDQSLQSTASGEKRLSDLEATKIADSSRSGTGSRRRARSRKTSGHSSSRSASSSRAKKKEPGSLSKCNSCQSQLNVLPNDRSNNTTKHINLDLHAVATRQMPRGGGIDSRKPLTGSYARTFNANNTNDSINSNFDDLTRRRRNRSVKQNIHRKTIRRVTASPSIHSSQNFLLCQTSETGSPKTKQNVRSPFGTSSPRSTLPYMPNVIREDDLYGKISHLNNYRSINLREAYRNHRSLIDETTGIHYKTPSHREMFYKESSRNRGAQIRGSFAFGSRYFPPKIIQSARDVQRHRSRDSESEGSFSYDRGESYSDTICGDPECLREGLIPGAPPAIAAGSYPSRDFCAETKKKQLNAKKKKDPSLIANVRFSIPVEKNTMKFQSRAVSAPPNENECLDPLKTESELTTGLKSDEHMSAENKLEKHCSPDTKASFTCTTNKTDGNAEVEINVECVGVPCREYSQEDASHDQDSTDTEWSEIETKATNNSIPKVLKIPTLYVGDERYELPETHPYSDKVWRSKDYRQELDERKRRFLDADAYVLKRTEEACEWLAYLRPGAATWLNPKRMSQLFRVAPDEKPLATRIRVNPRETYAPEDLCRNAPCQKMTLRSKLRKQAAKDILYEERPAEKQAFSTSLSTQDKKYHTPPPPYAHRTRTKWIDGLPQPKDVVTFDAAVANINKLQIGNQFCKFVESTHKQWDPPASFVDQGLLQAHPKPEVNARKLKTFESFITR